MKDKKLAAILALFLGAFGVHRFYLGQPGLGILYFLLSFSTISIFLGIIDAIVLYSMREEAFDLKYNREPFKRSSRRFDREYGRTRRRTSRPPIRQTSRRRKDEARVERPMRRTRRSGQRMPRRSSASPFKQSGVKKFKEYDYEGAIEDFEKAITINPKDIATHFNLACSYSLMENKNKALYHLDQAVQFGYKNLNNIRNHDALAYLRIQPEYEAFEANDFKLVKNIEIKEEGSAEENQPQPQATTIKEPDEDNLLEQLKKLSELRQKGLLTAEQYAVEKKRLLE